MIEMKGTSFSKEKIKKEKVKKKKQTQRLEMQLNGRASAALCIPVPGKKKETIAVLKQSQVPVLLD